MFLLDTDHLGIMQRQTEPEFSRLRSRMGQHPPSLFFVSIVSFHEQVTGWNAYLNRSRGTAGVVRTRSLYGWTTVARATERSYLRVLSQDRPRSAIEAGAVG